MVGHWALIVEDDPMDVTSVRRAFESVDASLRLEVHSSMESAWVQLRGMKGKALPTFVLVDVTLPGKTGLELLRLIRGSTALATLPVAIWSGSVLQVDRDGARRLGADHFFVKPDDFEQLQAECRHMCDSWTRFSGND